MSSTDTNRLLGPILQSVSRSFYLSIRFLPSGLRQPVGLAYLLARATDTIADTTEIPAEVRLLQLESLAAAIQGSPTTDIRALQTSFAPLQTNPAERALINSLPDCFEILQTTTADDRQEIQEVLAKINRAQVLDVQRFGYRNAVRALWNVAELNEYTYLIAGCVGEFWTRICSRHIAHFAELPGDQMLDLGRRYGEGLQLVNILRDLGTDLRTGRCYLPIEELAKQEIGPDQILEQSAKFMPIFDKWLERAERGLNAGREYSMAIRPRRVRGATALPALIGMRTIVAMKAAGEEVLRQKIKIPRNEVTRMVRTIGLTLASKKTLERMFWEL